MRVPFVAALLLSAMVLPSLGATVEEVSCKADELGVRSNIIMEMVRNLTDAPLVAPIGTSSLGGSRGVGGWHGTRVSGPPRAAQNADSPPPSEGWEAGGCGWPVVTSLRRALLSSRRLARCCRQEMGPCPAKPRTQEA